MAHPHGWIPDDEISDRRAYEQRVVQALTRYAAEGWKRDRLTLAEVEITGAYPETLIALRVERASGGPPWQGTIAVWPPGNGRVLPEGVWRWTAEKYAAVISDGIVEELTACS